MIAQDLLRHDLVAFAAASRSLMTMMCGGMRMPALGNREVTGGFGVSLGGAAVRDESGDGWNRFKAEAGEAIIAALRASIGNMPSALQLGFWIDADGGVTKVWMNRSSGDPGIDDIARNQVMRRLRFAPPPEQARMPLVFSVIITPGAWIYAVDEEA